MNACRFEHIRTFLFENHDLKDAMSASEGTYMMKDIARPLVAESEPTDNLEAESYIKIKSEVLNCGSLKKYINQGHSKLQGGFQNETGEDDQKHHCGHGDMAGHKPHLPHLKMHGFLRSHQKHPLFTCEMKQELFEVSSIS